MSFDELEETRSRRAAKNRAAVEKKRRGCKRKGVVVEEEDAVRLILERNSARTST